MKIKVNGVRREVYVVDSDCPKRPCFVPHDCPVHGNGGVHETASRWMCLTNAMHGCPTPKPAPEKGNPQAADELSKSIDRINAMDDGQVGAILDGTAPEKGEAKHE